MSKSSESKEPTRIGLHLMVTFVLRLRLMSIFLFFFVINMLSTSTNSKEKVGCGVP